MNKNTNKCRFFILTKNHACKIPLGVGKLHHFLTASAEKCNFLCYQTKESETIISFLVSNNEFKEDWRLVTNKIHKKTLAT